jgi:hypothetical protein
MKEIEFDQLSIFYKNNEGNLESIKGVSMNVYLLFNSQEIMNQGFCWSEDVENRMMEIMNHISWLMARDLTTRSHQSSGAKNCKQFIDPEDHDARKIKPISFNSFPNSVNILNLINFLKKKMFLRPILSKIFYLLKPYPF